MNLDLSLEHFSVDFEDVSFLVHFSCFIQNCDGALVDLDSFIVFAVALQNKGHGGQLVDLVVNIDLSCHGVDEKESISVKNGFYQW